MRIADIMTSNVFTLLLDDTVGKALNIMSNRRINQIPITDRHRKYQGMVFAKDILNVNVATSSKLKNFVRMTPLLNPSDNIKRCTRLVVTTGNRSLPVVENSKLIGILSETDVLPQADFGNTTVDNVMAGAIVIEDDTTLDTALAKMRRHNISRLPVINSRGDLTGVVNALDRAKIMATPKQRIAKDSKINSLTGAVSQVKVRDIMRKTIPIRMGTKLGDVLEHFKKHEELVIVGGDKTKPIGIVTPRDALEITLLRQEHPPINIANVSDYEVRRTIEDHIARFLKKIHRKREDIKSVLVYADKYKTRKYSLRARLISTRHVIDAKAVGYDPLSATKKLVSVLDGRIRTEGGKKSRQRPQQRSGKYLLV